MRLFQLRVTADFGRGNYCFTDREPDGLGVKSVRLAQGKAISEDYPENPWEVGLRLGEDYPGLKLPSFIGNTGSFLLFHEFVVKVLRQHNVGKIEVLPFTLYDHKNRVYSKSYVFVNLLGTIDCLNLEKSNILFSEPGGEILRVRKIVLDKTKIKNLCDLFRPREKPESYIFSERLVEALRSMDFTNLVYEELEVV